MAQIMKLAKRAGENHIFWISPFATFLTFFGVTVSSFANGPFCKLHRIATSASVRPISWQKHLYLHGWNQSGRNSMNTMQLPSCYAFLEDTTKHLAVLCPWHVLCHLGQIAAAKHSATRKGRHAHSCNSLGKPGSKSNKLGKHMQTHANTASSKPFLSPWLVAFA